MTNKKTALILTIYLILIIVSLAMASAITITSVTNSPKIIAPGESSRININIENEFDYDIEDVSVSLDLINVPFAPYDSSSEASFDEIQEGDEESVEFEIIALSEAKSGIYKIPLEIKYKVSGESEIKTKKSLIGISVNSKPIISASVEDGILLKNQENTLSIKITNKGLSDVKFLEIELQPGTYYTLLSEKNIYLGDIDSDDFDSAEIKIYFKENSPNTINFPLIIKYKDNLNNEYEDSVSLQAKTYSKKQATDLGLIKKSNTAMYISLLVAVIIIYILYRSIRKRIKMRENKESL